MNRVQGPNVAPGNLFTEGDPLLAIPCTEVPAVWLNDVQEELANAIEGILGPLDAGDQEQLTKAILRAAATGSLGNVLANGNFRFWQRNGPSSGNNPTTATLGFHGPDRWLFDSGGAGAAGTLSRVSLVSVGASSFSGEDTVLRWNKTAAGAAGEVFMQQRAEHCSTLAGRRVVFAFDAFKLAGADLAIVGVDLIQNFGTGGVPSADVTVAMTPHAGLLIDGTPRRLVFTADLPSIAGKTIGTTLDKGWLAVKLKVAQSVTFDVYVTACVLSPGPNDPGWFPRPFVQEIALCRRYFQKSTGLDSARYEILEGQVAVWDTAWLGSGDVLTLRPRLYVPAYRGSGVNLTTWHAGSTVERIQEDAPAAGFHAVTTSPTNPTFEGQGGAPRITAPPAGGTLRQFRGAWVVNHEIGTET